MRQLIRELGWFYFVFSSIFIILTTLFVYFATTTIILGFHDKVAQLLGV